MTDKRTQEILAKWENEKPLYLQLPIKYKGGVTFTQLDGQCLGCSKEINKEHMHGTITKQLEHVSSVEAVGWCPECNLLTPFSCRVRGENGQLVLEWFDKKTGWQKTACRKSFFNNLLKWLN